MFLRVVFGGKGKEKRLNEVRVETKKQTGLLGKSVCLVGYKIVC